MGRKRQREGGRESEGGSERGGWKKGEECHRKGREERERERRSKC